MLSFTRSVERNARNWPDKPAYTFLDQSVTNAELLERVRALAAAFAAQGVGRGDVVALLLGNGPQFLEITLALNGLG
ncbi:MAG: AMP-binding protein, partial [Actinomycetota bacterium]|nr:AMP-binding protein [Actinomycetota bacterium]